MITYSGAKLYPKSSVEHDGYQVSLDDIALMLSRTSRWRGQTRIPYTLLCHSIVVGLCLDDDTAIYGFMHDFSEFISDMPTTWKTPAFKQMEEELQEGFYEVFGIPKPTIAQQVKVSEVDRYALLAEAKLLEHRAYPVLEKEIRVTDKKLYKKVEKTTQIYVDTHTSERAFGNTTLAFYTFDYYWNSFYNKDITHELR